jgi:hypothetical protein
MKRVGVADLKNNLSRHLLEVERGEHIDVAGWERLRPVSSELIGVECLRAIERCECALIRLLDRLEIGQIPWSIEVDTGNAALKILTHAQMCGADLIVIGTAGLHEGDNGNGIGSVTSNVNRMADCPVLTVGTSEEVKLHKIRHKAYSDICEHANRSALHSA